MSSARYNGMVYQLDVTPWLLAVFENTPPHDLHALMAEAEVVLAVHMIHGCAFGHKVPVFLIW